MFKKVASWVALPLVCAGLLLNLAPAEGAEALDATGKDLLRVAIPTSATGLEDTSSLAYIGYTEEYLYEISKYTGWRYEMVTIPGDYESSLREVTEMLRAGTVDLIAPVAINDEMAESGIYYAQSSYLTTTFELQIPNAVYSGEKLEDHVRVAMVQGNGSQSSADAFFARNEITPEYVLCQNVTEQIEMVRSGQADVMINAALENIPDMTVIAQFSPQELYFAAADSWLIEELDRANVNIMQSNVLFAQELYEKYVNNNSQVLTQAETEFIQQSDPYVVAVLDDFSPYQDFDGASKTYKGIGVDLLQHIANSTGLQFQFVRVESQDELGQLISEGKVQIVAAKTYNHESMVERNLVLTRNYAASPYVLVSRSDFPGPSSEQRLALTREGIEIGGGNQIGSVRQYGTVQDCLDAIIDGEADYTYMDLYTAQYYLGDFRYTGLEMETQSYTQREVCFGIAGPADPALLSILNKAINELSSTEIQNFISQNTNPDRPITFLGLIQDYPLQVLLTVIVAALMIAALLILMLWRKEKHRKILHKRAMEDGLTQLYNAAACRKLVTRELQQFQPDQIGAFLIMDMDNFKSINDGFGHQEGDRVIQEFASLLRDVLRVDSVIARIGGDEFVAFLPSVKEEENIRLICGRIRKQSHSICVGDRSITISIGAVVASAGDDYDSLYHLSDQALYQVKKQTKDHFCLLRRESAS